MSARVWGVAVVVLANLEAESAAAAEASLLVNVSRALRADRTGVVGELGRAYGLAPFEAEAGTVADWVVPS